MKKLHFLACALLIGISVYSCTKEKESVTAREGDSLTIVSDSSESTQNFDSGKLPDSVIDSSAKVQEVLKNGVMRSEEDGEIIRTVDASAIPFTIGDEFKDTKSHMILKIKNFELARVQASVNPEDSLMNIRINQIKFPDGTLDGPFGRSLDLNNKGNGELWLVIGKSNMSSGNPVGKFTISVE